MPAYNVVTEDGYYSYTLNGQAEYSKTIKVDAAAVTAALDGTADGMYYLWKYGLPGATEASYAFGKNDSTAEYLMIDSYPFKEVTTGFWKVTTAATGKTVASADVYLADGTVVDAGDELTASTDYYAKVGTTFTWDKVDGADEIWTVTAADTSDKTFA